MREVAEDVAEVEAGHGDFGYYHLEESREGGEHAELFGVKTKTGSGAEVTALHDTGRNEDLGMLLVNTLQASRALQITCRNMDISTFPIQPSA